MSGGLWDFLIDIPSEGYIIKSLYCTGGECSSYTGNIEPNNIWGFSLVSPDGKVEKKFETGITNFREPRIRLSVDNSGEKIDFDISPENCSITEDGSLCIYGNNQDHELKIFVKKY